MSRLNSSLTPRRGETLETLGRLLAEQGQDGGVHYSDVARRMGISAWTAYGLLRELERIGLVGRRYAVGSGERLGGRSRILFVPTPPAAPAFLTGEFRERLRPVVERFSAIADEGAAVSAYLAGAIQGNDLIYHLGFWMGRLQAAGRNAQESLRSVLESGAVPAAKIQTVAAMGLGSALARLDRARLAARVTAATNAFTLLLEEAQRGPDTKLAALVEAAQGVQATTGRGRRMLSS